MKQSVVLSTGYVKLMMVSLANQIISIQICSSKGLIKYRIPTPDASERMIWYIYTFHEICIGYYNNMIIGIPGSKAEAETSRKI
jgi:hypothetical protein